MKHPARHVFPLQTMPLPQLVPVGAVDHAVVDVVGVHTRQALFGLSAPGA
jgi:hypothetical protein